MESGDGNFKVKFGGRLMFDMQFVDSDPGLDPALGENAVGFRRARFHFSGSVDKNTVFRVQIDFAGGDVEFKDVYVGLTASHEESIGTGSLNAATLRWPIDF
jgi:phosphate-selective porin OprO/OprP